MKLSPAVLLVAALLACPAADAFSSTSTTRPCVMLSSTAAEAGATESTSSTTDDDETEELKLLATTVSKLKRVLAKEYTSFFNPMVDSWYAPDVTFDDPMTSLSGVDSYRKNVDMLAGRTLMGQILFDGAGINLHSVTGGEIVNNNGRRLVLEDIVTRWTLRLTAKILPWSPEAVFSGVSVYKLEVGGPEGLSIVGQTDYWDSINIQPNTSSTNVKEQYQKVSKSIAVNDFLGQLAPDGFLAPTAAPELPYLLLRRGNGYEIRKYPGFVGIETPYQRRDYGFGSLGAFAKGMDPLAPSIMKVWNDDNVDDDSVEDKEKMMLWPLKFTLPGEGTEAPPPPAVAIDKAGDGQWKSIKLATCSERIIAIRTFEDAAMGPVVCNADRELRALLKRDGLVPTDESKDYVVFAQYDAVHSMGKRRGEVWIELKDGGHPF